MIVERDPKELNKNRKGPLKEAWAIADVDLEGNANVLKAITCTSGCERPLIAVEESAFEQIKDAFRVLQSHSKRRLVLVRLEVVETIL